MPSPCSRQLPRPRRTTRRDLCVSTDRTLRSCSWLRFKRPRGTRTGSVTAIGGESAGAVTCASTLETRQVYSSKLYRSEQGAHASGILWDQQLDQLCGAASCATLDTTLGAQKDSHCVVTWCITVRNRILELNQRPLGLRSVGFVMTRSGRKVRGTKRLAVFWLSRARTASRPRDPQSSSNMVYSQLYIRNNAFPPLDVKATSAQLKDRLETRLQPFLTVISDRSTKATRHEASFRHYFDHRRTGPCSQRTCRTDPGRRISSTRGSPGGLPRLRWQRELRIQRLPTRVSFSAQVQLDE